MFTLRILTSGGPVVTNYSLGKVYTVSYPDSIPFKRETSEMDVSKIKCIVHSESGETFVIWRESEYFVMTDSGKTFERL